MLPVHPSRLTLAAACSLLLLFLALGAEFIRSNSQTSDEAGHLVSGYCYLTRHDFRLNPEHPPLIKMLSALPVFLVYRLPFDPDPRMLRTDGEWRMGLDFLYGSSVPHRRILALARAPNLLLGACLVGLIGWWAYRLWGRGAALMALALSALEPNLLAHACLVTTDLGAALFMCLALYLLWEYLKAPGWALLAAVGVASGLALVTKYSTVLLLGILPLLVLCHLLTGGRFTLPGGVKEETERNLARESRGAAAGLLLVFSVAALVIPLAYHFQGFSPWVSGFLRLLAHQAKGHPAFFLGNYSDSGWWTYFLVAFLIKTPLGSLLLILASLILPRAGRALLPREAILLLLPVALLFAATSMARIDIGLRHMLAVYPLLFVSASRLATLRFRRAFAKPLLLGLPLAWTALSTLSIAPHQLAYFNQLVGGPGKGYRYLSDSNLDWGQDLEGVQAYMRREGLPMIYLSYFGTAPPSAYGIRYQNVHGYGNLLPPPGDRMPPEPGREILAVSALNLQGVLFRDRDLYGWLARRRPVAKIGYSIFVYDLTGDSDAHLQLAKVYFRAGPVELALPELKKALRLDPGNREAEHLLRAFP